MATVRITWQRTCEYVADVDTAELRAQVNGIGPEERHTALSVISDLEAGREPVSGAYGLRQLAYLISNTGTGREWLGALADDNPELMGGTGVPEITELTAAEEAGQ